MIPEDQGGGGHTLSTLPIPKLELAENLLFHPSENFFFARNSLRIFVVPA